MLQELKVSQFAIIDNLHIEFQKGLNILSGETGSGKSVLLKSLSLLMGEKASSDIIRVGSQQAVVEGSFDLNDRPDIQKFLADNGIETPEKTLIVKRVIAQSDKSKVYLNGSLCTLSQLKEVVAPMIEVTGHSAPLIEMTGQHDNRNLLSKSYHLDLLDQYANQTEKRKIYEEKYQSLQNLKVQIFEFEKQSHEKNQKLDFLKFQLAELEKINLNPAADETLEDDIRNMRNSHKILQFADESENILFENTDSVVSRLKYIEKKALELGNYNLDGLEQARTLIEDTFFNLRKKISSVQLDTQSLEEKEARLSQIRKLQKKYGSDLAVIFSMQEQLKNEVFSLENSDLHLENLKKQAAQEELELKKNAEELHQSRVKYAKKLIEAVNKELLDLNMKGVTFSIQTNKHDEIQANGISDIEYLCKISPKDPERPIAKVASGGELSRILLSLKKALGESDLPRTYLFDEVDTGVSGNTAEKVGRKLKDIAKGQQVICVTHLPQVAACGDVHFSIYKETAKSGVNMYVTELKSKNRIEEIARLISGEKITKTSLAHAEQLLSEA